MKFSPEKKVSTGKQKAAFSSFGKDIIIDRRERDFAIQ